MTAAMTCACGRRVTHRCTLCGDWLCAACAKKHPPGFVKERAA